MLNTITIAGRLTRDPELRYTQSQVAVASFTVAVDRDYASQGQEKETDFIDCVAWRSTGEFVQRYFQKGSMIIVTGRLQSRKWTDRDGNKRTSWEILADHCYFGGSKSDQGSSQSQQSGSYGQASHGGGYQQFQSRGSQQQSYRSPSGGVNAYPGPGEFQELDDGDGELPF